MRALIIENFEETHAGLVTDALTERGADLTVLRPHEGDALPGTTRDYDAMVILGGAQSALDDAGSPYLPDLLDLIRERVRRDAPLLGICLGSQLIARALGGENRIGGHLEFGYHQVTPISANVAGDPLFGNLTSPATTFQWHTDAATLPPGTVHLMTSDVAPCQAFRAGQKVYATQFHFEASSDMVNTWVGKAGDWLDEHIPDWRDRIVDFPEKAPLADSFGMDLARRWVKLID